MNQTEKRPDVYEIVTNRIIEQLEKGNVPWKRLWMSNAGAPRNLITMRPYRGINLLLLSSLRYRRNYFLTFRQAKEMQLARALYIVCMTLNTVIAKIPNRKKILKTVAAAVVESVCKIVP